MNNMSLDYKNKEKFQLVEEKQALENTLKSLSSEVEALSSKNEQFLNHLKMQNFYEQFIEINQELANLKEAHMVLINLIENNELKISNETSHVKFYKENQNFFSPIWTWHPFGSFDGGYWQGTFDITPEAKHSFA